MPSGTKPTTTALTVKAPRGLARHFEPDLLISQWREDMESRAAAGEISPNTATTYYLGMAKFWAWFQAQDTYTSVGPRAIRSWIASMRAAGRRASGVNVRYAGVRAFFVWAMTECGLAYNPTAGVKGAKLSGRGHRRACLTDHEVLRVLAQPDTETIEGKRARALLSLMAYTGVRTIEVQRARIGDLSGNGKLKLWVRGKGHNDADEAVYVVHPHLLDALYDWLAIHPRGKDPTAPLFCAIGGRTLGKALTTRWIASIVKTAYRQAGILAADKTTHSLRHTLVTNLIRHGVAPTKIMTVTRHKSLDTLLAYAHEMDRDDDPAEAYVDYTNGSPT